MATPFDEKFFLAQLDQALNKKAKAIELGKKYAKAGVKTVFLVGCGSPNRAMAGIRYFLDRDIKSLQFYSYFPAEFLYQEPAKLDKDSLVLLISHSGTTPEVVAVSEYLKDKECHVAAVTQFETSPLAKNVQDTILYGESKAGYKAEFMLALALLTSLVKETDNWPIADAVLKGIDAFPQVMADVQALSDKQCAEYAKDYKDDDFFMVMGAGPCFPIAAYVAGVCIMMEMQWLHTSVGESAEFFHGPFEVILPDVPVMVFLGEDESRPISERVIRFCNKFTERLMVFDSKDYEMKGIPDEAREVFAPFVAFGASERFYEHLAVWHNHPLSTRRYMWKFEY